MELQRQVVLVTGKSNLSQLIYSARTNLAIEDEPQSRRKGESRLFL